MSQTHQEDTVYLPWLYKFDAKGVLKRWRCGTKGNVFFAEYGTVFLKSGAQGKIRKTEDKLISANTRESDPVKQAQTYADQEWREKQRKDEYYPSKEIPTCTPDEWRELNGNTRRWPAVCAKWEDVSETDKDCTMTKPWLMQYKIDGNRCTAWYENDQVLLFSRKCLPMEFKDHLRDQLLMLFPLINFLKTGDENHYTSYSFGIDGEIWNPKVGSHQQNNSISSRRVNRHEKEDEQCFAWFDILDYELDANGRFDLIQKAKDFLLEADGNLNVNPEVKGMDQKQLCVGGDLPNVFIVTTKLATDFGDLYEFYEHAIDISFEGLVLRRPTHMYPKSREHRTSQMIKMKPFQDAEFEVIGFKQGEGDRSGCVVWECRNDINDGTFSTSQMGPVEFQRELYEAGEEFIGSKITVRFDVRSDDGLPVRPRAVRFRGEEDMP